MLSKEAEAVKADLEQIIHINRQIKNLEQEIEELRSHGFPRKGQTIFVQGGALNKTEEMIIGIISACEDKEKKILELKSRKVEIMRKVDMLKLLSPDQYNMIYDRYFRLPRPTLEDLAVVYFYHDRQYMSKIYNLIFERLAWL